MSAYVCQACRTKHPYARCTCNARVIISEGMMLASATTASAFVDMYRASVAERGEEKVFVDAKVYAVIKDIIPNAKVAK